MLDFWCCQLALRDYAYLILGPRKVAFVALQISLTTACGLLALRFLVLKAHGLHCISFVQRPESLRTIRSILTIVVGQRIRLKAISKISPDCGKSTASASQLNV
ncbi:hypothetical protein QQP08_015749 [Theobroma cacao]|nr:hypothetical protein QQP08_015749 [Theobroma cacao]